MGSTFGGRGRSKCATGRDRPQIGPQIEDFLIRLSGWRLKRLRCMQECGSAQQGEPTSLCPANCRASLPTGQVSKSNSYLYWTDTGLVGTFDPA